MLRFPKRGDYATNQHYLLAILGYAVCVGASGDSSIGEITDIFDIGNGSGRCCHLSRVVEGSVGSGDRCGSDGVVAEESGKCITFGSGKRDVGCVGVDRGGDRDSNCGRSTKSVGLRVDCVDDGASSEFVSRGLDGDASRGDSLDRMFVGRGINYERNKKNREQKKIRKQKKRMMQGKTWRHEGSDGVDVKKDALRESLEEKWRAQNDLAVFKARRQLAVLESNDLELEKKKHSTQVRMAVEKNMVAIERSHGYLSSTDNVPSGGDGEIDDAGSRIRTVVEDGPSLTSGSISPNSSASMAEYRKCQKDLLDSVALNERYEKAFKSINVSLEAVENKDRSVWTDNSTSHRILDEIYDGCYPTHYEGVEEGKFSINQKFFC